MQVVDDFRQGLLFERAQQASDLRHRFAGKGTRGVFILNHATVGRRPNPEAREAEMFCIGREPCMDARMPVVFHVRRPVREEKPELLPITAILEAR